MPTAIIFLIVLLVVVVVHEWGHFITAKKTGMRVNEFAFGFPPKLFSFKKDETTYSFNAVPLGGYVAIDGENGKTDEEIKNDNRLFTAKPRWAQALVLFAGPLMNLVLAFVLLAASYMVGYGDGNNSKNLVVLSVAPNSAAEISGIKAGDKINSVFTDGDIDPSINPDADFFRNTVQTSNGKEITIDVTRANENKLISLVPTNESGEYRAGISMGMLENKKLGFFSSIKQGFIDTCNLTWDTVLGFGKIIGGLFVKDGVKASLTGPIGIAKEVGTASHFGFAYLLSFVALISVNLGVLNLFPFPALDGGRLLFLLIEKIKGSRINPKVANIFNMVGFGLLLLLMLVITIKDVIKLF